MERNMRESEKNWKALQTMFTKAFATKVFGKYFDSGLLGVVHHGNYSGHFGIG